MEFYSFKTAIFDMDGVITKTARVHANAWKLVFDEYLRLREKKDNQPFKEFTHEDYLAYVDGKPRLKGIKSFLASRGINLPEGDPEDSFDKETIYAIGNEKNLKFRQVLKTDGVEVYAPTLELINKFKDKEIRIGVVSSSKNCQYILEAASIIDLFDTRVDGVVAEQRGLEGKPEGDIFVTAALELESLPAESVVFEDAISGVQAGRNGGFGLVVGVARSNNVNALNENGADIVVTTLADLDQQWIEKWFSKKPISLFDVWDNTDALKQVYTEFITGSIVINPYYLCTPKSIFESNKKIIFFLDYDGTLTPIVKRPELAVISDEMKDTVKKLAGKFTTAVVSGRMREDVENLLGIKGLFYAGSHGFDILGPGISMIQPQAQKTIPLVNKVSSLLKAAIGSIEGVIIEEKKFSVAAHYRLVPEQYLPKIKEAVEKVVNENKQLRLMQGKKVFEILPAIDWNKGKAVCWIMKALGIPWKDSLVIYIGDDTTDEDAFRTVNNRGISILVSEETRKSVANFRLSTPEQVGNLFRQLVDKS